MNAGDEIDVARRAEEFQALREQMSSIDSVVSAPVSSPSDLPAADYGVEKPVATVHLSYPFTLDGKRIKSVGLRPPSFDDVQSVLSGSISELQMQARMAGVSVSLIQSLRWPDLEVVAVIARHLAPEIGKR